MGRPTAGRESLGLHDALDRVGLGRRSALHWRGDVSVARKANLMDRCVKRKLDERGEFETEDGLKIHLETFPLCGLGHSKLRDYGCPAAVNLYLRFLLECAAVFALMFAVSSVTALDSAWRTAVRNGCRDELTAWASSPGNVSASCGYDGLPVRANVTEVPWYLAPALGVCEEYRSGSEVVLPMPDPRWVGTEGDMPTVETPGAKFCASASAVRLAGWCGLLNVWLFLAFLVRLRRLQRTTARDVDRALWTAADYAVMVRGLEREVRADDDEMRGVDGLRSRLGADLERLGFPPDAVDHIEVGRQCEDDCRLLRRLRHLRVAQLELNSRQKHRVETGQKESAADDAREQRLSEQVEELVTKLEQLRHEGHDTTGHAFVVFKTERTRNRFIRLFHRSRRERFLRAALCLGPPAPPRLEAASRDGGARRAVAVTAAPEPSDVCWENLGKGDGYVVLATSVTYSLTLLLVGVGVVSCVLLKASEVEFMQQIDDRRWEMETTGDGAEVESLLYSSLLSAGISTVIVVINLLLKLLINMMARREGHDTQTDFERSVFTKLALAYVLNTVVLPLVVGCIPYGLTQAWYERGGTLQDALMLTLSNAIIPDVLKVVQPYALLLRYGLAPFVVSQHKLNQLHRPPKMLLGELYAATVKTVSLGLLYGALYPPMYLLTAVALGITFWGSKFAVCRWYARPPHVDVEMLTRLRSSLGLLVGLHIGLLGIGAWRAADPRQYQPADFLPLVFVLVLWLFHNAAPLSLLPWLAEHSSDRHEEEMDTEGVRYDQVRSVKKYEIDRYECPAANHNKSIAQLELDTVRISSRREGWARTLHVVGPGGRWSACVAPATGRGLEEWTVATVGARAEASAVCGGGVGGCEASRWTAAAQPPLQPPLQPLQPLFVPSAQPPPPPSRPPRPAQPAQPAGARRSQEAGRMSWGQRAQRVRASVKHVDMKRFIAKGKLRDREGSRGGRGRGDDFHDMMREERGKGGDRSKPPKLRRSRRPKVGV